MSNDYFNLLVQMPNGKWRVALNQDMLQWQSAQNKYDYRMARKIMRDTGAPVFKTLAEARDYGDENGHVDFGEVIIDYEGYYND